jgi:tetratricopeptide (TPR) repeat protein
MNCFEILAAITRHELGIDLFLGGLGLAVAIWTIVKAEDPVWMLLRWVGTGLLLWFILAALTPLIGILMSVFFIVLWRKPLTNLAASPFENLFTGGSEPPIPRPYYSIAQGKLKLGKHTEAIGHIHGQLEKFPNDFEGQMLLAQIQAENLHDLDAAEMTIQKILAQPGHTPSSIYFALSAMADWHLKYGQDPDAARVDFEKIIELLPETEFAAGAANRIAHLSSREMLLSTHDRKILAVPQGIKNLGLQINQTLAGVSEAEPGQAAQDLVNQLHEHPMDFEAREKLALLYANHYHRLDLASDQLEQLIQMPNQQARAVAHWLNLLADIQIREGADIETVRATIERIVDANPNVAAADLARNRLSTLPLEFRKRSKSQALKLGSYEQNIGLKGNLPRPRHEM